MKLTQQQRDACARQERHAIIEALRAEFTGDGAATRRLRFIRGALFKSADWMAKIAVLLSWAFVASILVGPDHESALRLVIAWGVATPVDQAVAQSHSIVVSLAWQLAEGSLALGFLHQLLVLVKPAADDARQRFTASLA